MIRKRILVQGIVQGVGFRPFVYSLATKHALTGYVFNESSGVVIEIQGEPEALAIFETEIKGEPPPLSRIDSIKSSVIQVCDESLFFIKQSMNADDTGTPVSPDIGVCDDCLHEMFDTADRRYRYPFINCTHCGPRFTILKDIPYDRGLTTMSVFPMCSDCQNEYDDPANRRFHAQPNACPKCGPKVWFVCEQALSDDLNFCRSTPQTPEGDAGLEAATESLARGKIVAIKGIGGFHLACDATNDDVLRLLRDRKGRVDKPFAIMVQNLDAARELVQISDEESRVLTCRQRPIVLLKRRTHTGSSILSRLVAPGNDFLGVMLPYSPLHYLIVGKTPLVMTSGNLGDEPIVRTNVEVRARLALLADAYLLHDRDIHTVCDDSVVRVVEGAALPIRRSRGYAPMPLILPVDGPSVLAVGGEMKATFCLTKGKYAFMSQHIGDMGNLETLEAFERVVDHFRALFRVSPELVACDMHLGYVSTAWATKFAEENRVPLISIQHHHAHVASVLCEHGYEGEEPVMGVSFDGTGYGTDGAIWGGEFLFANRGEYERIAHLKYLPLPGGDASIKRPYRVALATLWALKIPWDEQLPCVAACSAEERALLHRQLERNLNCTSTSSMGRLFDAASAMIGARQTVTYEAQAAMEMEALCDSIDLAESYTFGISQGTATLIDPEPVIRSIVNDVLSSRSKNEIASRFHASVVNMIHDICVRLRSERETNVVALTGGVFQNIVSCKPQAGDSAMPDSKCSRINRSPPTMAVFRWGKLLLL